jgi:hypothetical protein
MFLLTVQVALGIGPLPILPLFYRVLQIFGTVGGGNRAAIRL